MMDETKIKAMVRRIVHRTVGMQSETPSRRKLVTESDVRDLPFGSQLRIPTGSLVTPLARQVAMDRQIDLIESRHVDPHQTQSSSEISASSLSGQGRIAIGADHGGFALKLTLTQYLNERDLEVIDCGTDGPNSVDYPDFALAVANLVAQGQVDRGIMIDGAGIGSCMTANKVPGVRAAMCYDQATAINSREHNNANILTLGAGLIGEHLAKQILDSWLDTGFAGGRHARRVDKITLIEKRFLK
jgi:ribose 5-phosphate isomerase B